MRHIIGVCAAVGFVAGSTLGAHAQPAGDGGARSQGGRTSISGTCTPNKITYRTADSTVNTTSSTFAQVPQMILNFTQGGDEETCVIVRYSGMGAAMEPRLIFIRVLLDGTEVAEPGNVQFEGYTPGASTARSFDFIFPSVEPGNHQVKVEWRSFNGEIVFMHRRSMVVQHR